MAYARTPHELNKFFEEGKPGDVIEAPYSVLKTWITDYPKPTMEQAESDSDACLSKRGADPTYLCNRLKGHVGVHAWIDYTGTAKTIWPQVWSPEPKTEPVEASICDSQMPKSPHMQCNLTRGHEGPHSWEEFTWTDEKPVHDDTMRHRALMGVFYSGPEGRCKKIANLEGTSIQCNLSAQHEGWAHQSREHHLIWES